MKTHLPFDKLASLGYSLPIASEFNQGRFYLTRAAPRTRWCSNKQMTIS
jgi:hypothetical protein